ncbi:murein biosynthesis integral membrane protein MurJ [Pseudochelatococcus sp. B33]
MSRFRSVARAGAAVGAASVASRLLGFARDVLIAGVLGAGVVADAFLVAFRIPNVIRRVLGEGGLNAGFVPLYGEVAAREGKEAARRFAGRTIVNAALFFAALAGLAELAAGALVLAVATGFGDDANRFALAVCYTRLALPFIAFTGLASLLAALLNAERRFMAAAVAPALVNGVLIAALLLLPGGGTADDPATGAWLAVAISLSGLLHLAIVAWAAARMPDCPPLPPPRLDADARRLVAFAIPALVASSMTQIILLAAMALASGQPSAVSWLYYADRVFQLPLSFIGVAAGVVLLPEFVAGRQGTPALSAALTDYLTGALALALPAAAGLIALGASIVSVLFERGAFTATDGRATAALLMALAIGLPAAGASKVLSQPFFARREVRPPLAAGLAGVLVTLGCGLLLSGLWGDAVTWRSPFTGAPVPFGTIGLAASLGLWAQALVLVVLGRAQIAWSGQAGSRLARLSAAALLMGLIVAAADGLAASWLDPRHPVLLRGAVLAALIIGGVLVYLEALRTLGALNALPLKRRR